MIPWLDPFRTTALPALLFLAWLPVFAVLPARHAMRFFVIASLATLLVVAGPIFAAGIAATIVLGYLLAESVARLHTGRRAGLVAGVGLLHLAYFGCFYLPLPPAFTAHGLRATDQAGVFIFFSGIGLTFLRLLSYFIERVRGTTSQLTLGDYLAHIFFFPQFLHGPIERAKDFVPKLRAAREGWTVRDIAAGLARVVVGLVTLLAIVPVLRAVHSAMPPALRDAPLAALADPEQLTLGPLLVFMHAPAVILYLLESGFASVQLGVSRAFGVRGTENFRWPLLAPNPRELWHRWNITFSGWLRDYVYIPLGGNRRHQPLNVLLVFVYCSLLHGLQPRCLAWGLWTGGTLALYTWIRGRVKRARPGDTHHPVAHAIGSVCARLLTFHWFSIGVLLILDPDYLGLRVLRRYLELLLSG